MVTGVMSGPLEYRVRRMPGGATKNNKKGSTTAVYFWEANYDCNATVEWYDTIQSQVVRWRVWKKKGFMGG